MYVNVLCAKYMFVIIGLRLSNIAGGNGAGQGNETEDEDHEFFDAVEEGVPSNMDDKTSFVMKVPVSII